MSDDLRLDVHAVELFPQLGLGAIVKKQHAGDLDRGTRLRSQAVDQDPIAWRDPVLLAAAHHDSRGRTIWLGHGERLYQRLQRMRIEVAITIATTSAA